MQVNGSKVGKLGDDLTLEEKQDIQEFYSDKAGHKTSSLEELIKELQE